MRKGLVLLLGGEVFLFMDTDYLLMNDCDYCSDSFESEEALLSHYDSKHYSELSRIDKKRVDARKEDELEIPVRTLVGAVFGVGILLALVYISVAGFPDLIGGAENTGELDAQIQPTGQNTRHYHGQVTITVDGQQVDLSQQQYQLQANAVHHEAGNGQRWHVHAQRVSVEYYLESLGFGPVTETTFQYNGETYSEAEGDTVRYLVNGQEIDPQQYIFQDGDTLRVVVEDGSN